MIKLQTAKEKAIHTRSRNRHPQPRRNHQPSRTSHLRARHSENQHLRPILKSINRDNAVLDRGRHASTQSDGSHEFGHDGQETDLDHGERACGHRGGVRVGDIVGAVSEGAEAECYGDNGEKPLHLVSCQ